MLPLRLPNDQLQQRWKSLIDPVLNIPMVQGLQLKDIALVTGNNVISHLLGKTQQGWIMTDIQGAAQVYRSQPFNNLTLTLTSDADVTVSIWVF